MSGARQNAEQGVMDRLPAVRGRLLAQAALAPLTWFRVGGPAEILFLPADEEDLAAFLKAVPDDIPVMPLGVGSNILVRDSGVPGVVVRFTGTFNQIEKIGPTQIRAGVGALDAAIAKFCAQAGLAGFEFLSGVPGSLGGALRMNAGAYGSELKDIFVSAVAYDRRGLKHRLSYDDMGFAYRKTAVPEDFIFVEAILEGRPDEAAAITARMEDIKASREASQPIRTRTGGSTFKNPDPARSGGRKAWQLIDAAGARGLVVGDAQVSEQHCNFLINRGAASARDLELLGEKVREMVAESTGITLDWEIRRIGNAKPESSDGQAGHE